MHDIAVWTVYNESLQYMKYVTRMGKEEKR